MSYLFPAQTITFDAALRDLASGSAKARAFAAHALGDVTDPVERRRAVDALIRALDDDRYEVRAEACASLGELREPGAVPALAKRLDDGIPSVRQNAAIALGTLRHPDGFEPLAAALTGGAPDVRFQAATSLAEIDGTRAFDPLVAALGDADAQVVAAAALSLGAIRDERAIALLLPKLEHADAGTRFDVAYALAELGDPAGRTLLVAALGDRERAWDAVDALGALGTPDDVAALARALGAASDAAPSGWLTRGGGKKFPPEAQVSAAATILRLAPDGAHAETSRKLLVDALTSRKEYVRAVAVERLAEVGGAWAIEPLEKLARSGKGTGMREAITEALRAIETRGSK